MTKLQGMKRTGKNTKFFTFMHLLLGLTACHKASCIGTKRIMIKSIGSSSVVMSRSLFGFVDNELSTLSSLKKWNRNFHGDAYSYGSFIPSSICGHGHFSTLRPLSSASDNIAGVSKRLCRNLSLKESISGSDHRKVKMVEDDEEENLSEEDDFIFKWESLDMSGKWKFIDWDNIDVKHMISKSEVDNTENDDYAVANIDRLLPTTSPDKPSPIELTLIRDRMVYIKRDDLLRLRGSNVSGNKARKFLALNEIPVDEFPDAIVSYGGPQSNAMVALAAIVQSKNAENQEPGEIKTKDKEENDIESILGVDYEDYTKDEDSLDEFSDDNDEDNDGGNLTSKETAAMLKGTRDLSESSSASFFSKQHSVGEKKKFVYYTKKLPRYLRKQPSGNLLRALSLGMELVEVSHKEYGELFGGDNGGCATAPSGILPPVPGRSVWIPQGGACGIASPGGKLLAQEIVSFWSKQGRGLPLSVCVPGGTCTTAMLLSREINNLLQSMKSNGEDIEHDIKVVAIPCVGDDGYARRQMRNLDRSTGGNGIDDIPEVLKPIQDSNYGSARQKMKGYFIFGEPASAILQTFLEMKEQHGVYLDLLYGAPAWSLLLQHWKAITSNGTGFRGNKYIDDDCPIAGRQIMYVHSGGLEGVSSQLTRYKHKGFIDESEIQA